MAAMVDRDHPVPGRDHVVVETAEVEVSARRPAVQHEDDRPIAAAVAQEELTAVRHDHGSRRREVVRRHRRMLGSGHRLSVAGLLTITGMAVVIASDLSKDISGEPLLRGISFKLERRDRMSLSGRNGAGKTTLLRMLSGEASIDGGELVLAKGTKIALHDQRPPRDRDMTLRDYVLSGAPELIALEGELERLEQRMAGGDYEEPTLTAYADAQAALEHAGGYTWRERALATLHGLGLNDEDALDRNA